MLFGHAYLLVTRNRRCSSVIIDIHYVSAIFKLYLSDVVQLFLLSLLLFSVLVEVLSKLCAV